MLLEYSLLHGFVNIKYTLLPLFLIVLGPKKPQTFTFLVIIRVLKDFRAFLSTLQSY